MLFCSTSHTCVVSSPICHPVWEPRCLCVSEDKQLICSEVSELSLANLDHVKLLSHLTCVCCCQRGSVSRSVAHKDSLFCFFIIVRLLTAVLVQSHSRDDERELWRSSNTTTCQRRCFKTFTGSFTFRTTDMQLVSVC